MKKMKDNIRYLLWLFGFRSYLPKSIIDNVVVFENKEILIEISENKKLIFSKSNENLCPFIRKSVYDLLIKASNLLPEGYSLVLIEAYRSLIEQEKKWIKRYDEVKKENPNLSEDEIRRITRLSIAEPTGYGPHQTGGAVDVSLSFNGIEVDMGTKWASFNTKTPTKSNNITCEQHKNRQILESVMIKVGFVNYPGEWWHYSYGDRMWAAYKRKGTCFYGQILK